MVAVFAGFAAGQLVMFQQMGFGLGVAILIDATLVRTVLMPAVDGAARRSQLVPAALPAWLPDLRVEPPSSPAPTTRTAPASPVIDNQRRAARPATPTAGRRRTTVVVYVAPGQSGAGMLAQSRDPLRGDNPLKHPGESQSASTPKATRKRRSRGPPVRGVAPPRGALDAVAGHDEAARLRLARRSRWPGLYPSHGAEPAYVSNDLAVAADPEETLE